MGDTFLAQASQFLAHLKRCDRRVWQEDTQAEAAVQEASDMFRDWWSAAFVQQEVGRDVRRLPEHCKLLTSFLRLFDFGLIHYDDERRGMIWINTQVAVWVDERRMQLTADPNLFLRMVSTDISRYWRADRYRKLRDMYHFQGTVAEIQYKVLSKLSNWQQRSL